MLRHTPCSLYSMPASLCMEGQDEVYSSCSVLKRDTLFVLLNLLLEPFLSDFILVILPSHVHDNGVGW